MTISASLVKELREHTGVGMMECKKALKETNGDLEAAITLLRKSGQAKAAKKGNRVAAEGTIIVKLSEDNKAACMLEINCETDFAARDEAFLEFANLIAQEALTNKVANLEALLAMQLSSGKTVAEAREDLVAKIGENINVRRIELMTIEGEVMISSYVHGNGRIGVLVALTALDAELGKDVAMHIAAAKPLATLPDELPKSLIDKEREIFLAQLQESGKPEQILEKIVEGKIQKFIGESVLIKQAFVKDPDVTVEELLKRANASVLDFARFEVGEGIEKKEADFAAEVQAQVEAQK